MQHCHNCFVKAPNAVASLEQLLVDTGNMGASASSPLQEAELWSPFEYLRGSKYLSKRILLQKTCLALPEPGGNKYRLVKTAGINCICQGSMEALREPTAAVAAEMDEMMEDP